MKLALRCVVLPVLLGSLVACGGGGGGGGGGPGATNVSQTIGTSGGTLTVTSGAPAGIFPDVVKIDLVDLWVQDPPATQAGVDRLTVWLQKGIGPIMYAVDGGTPHALTGAEVKGNKSGGS